MEIWGSHYQLFRGPLPAEPSGAIWEGPRLESSAGSRDLVHRGGQSRLPGSWNPGQLVPSSCCRGLCRLVCTGTDRWSLEVGGRVGVRLWAPGCATSMRQIVGSDTQGLCGIRKEAPQGLGCFPKGDPSALLWEETQGEGASLQGHREMRHRQQQSWRGG